MVNINLNMFPDVPQLLINSVYFDEYFISNPKNVFSFDPGSSLVESLHSRLLRKYTLRIFFELDEIPIPKSTPELFIDSSFRKLEGFVKIISLRRRPMTCKGNVQHIPCPPHLLTKHSPPSRSWAFLVSISSTWRRKEGGQFAALIVENCQPSEKEKVSPQIPEAISYGYHHKNRGLNAFL
ncbi:MAG: hypothetical protein LWX01_03905 [Deltaproteobacteria bacterium]|nr:hypothetical protein [Deltaproteobacteria bacterium]